MQKKSRLLRRLLTVTASIVAVFYACAIGYLKSQETTLVFQDGFSRASVARTLPAGVEEVSIPTEGGESVAAVVVRAEGEGGRRWILHFHGNADSAFSLGQIRHAQVLAALGWSVLAPDTRGMGKTPGRPSESHAHADAEASLQWLLTQGVPADHILIWGHSLGSGSAVELAARHPVAGLVLFGAFTSVPDIGAEMYPWLPVRLIATVRFDNLKRIADVHVPVVIAHAVTDATIPYAHSQRLFAAANEPKRALRLEASSNDGFGGHVEALYEQLARLTPLLAELQIIKD